jgi:hypothetical protein
MSIRLQPHPRKIRVSIAELMAVVAALAVALAWPVVLLPTCGSVLAIALHRAGFTTVTILLIMSILGFVLGLTSGFFFMLIR